MSKAKPTVAAAKRRLVQWHANRVLRASVPFSRRSNLPYITGPHGSITNCPAIVSGATRGERR